VGAVKGVLDTAYKALTEDKEGDKMAIAAKKMMKLTFGSPSIRSIRFTVG
jgi:hypothetical protein